jgi:hypothetical protein
VAYAIEFAEFYEISSDEANVVRILAVGKKKGNKVFIANKEIKL